MLTGLSPGCGRMVLDLSWFNASDGRAKPTVTEVVRQGQDCSGRGETVGAHRPNPQQHGSEWPIDAKRPVSRHHSSSPQRGYPSLARSQACTTSQEI